MEDRAGPSHVRDAGASSCAPWWSAFLHARADFAHVAEQPPSCRDYTRVERSCEVERDVRTGRDILHCKETREKFRICSESRVDRLATTSIETREPLLEGHTRVPARSWEPQWEAVPQPPDVSSSDGALTAASRHAQREQTSASGRLYRPFLAIADDGGSRGGSSVSAAPAALASVTGPDPATVLNPHVGQAVEDILIFADEMQRDLAHHGIQLLRRGEEEQRRKPGLVARLFGARGWGETTRTEAGAGAGSTYTGPDNA